MQYRVIVEHVLLDPGAAALLRTVGRFLGWAIVEIVMFIHIEAACAAVIGFQNGRKPTRKIAYVIGIVAVVLAVDAGIKRHPLFAVYLHKTSRSVWSVRCGIDSEAAGEQVDQQIDGPVLAHSHQRVNKGSCIELLGVCAVIEIVGEIVVPGFSVVIGIADNDVNAAGVIDMTPACVAGRY